MFAREVAVKHELTFNMPFMAVNTGLFLRQCMRLLFRIKIFI